MKLINIIGQDTSKFNSHTKHFLTAKINQTVKRIARSRFSQALWLKQASTEVAGSALELHKRRKKITNEPKLTQKMTKLKTWVNAAGNERHKLRSSTYGQCCSPSGYATQRMERKHQGDKEVICWSLEDGKWSTEGEWSSLKTSALPTREGFTLRAGDIVRWVVFKIQGVDIESSKLKPINHRKHAMVDVSWPKKQRSSERWPLAPPLLKLEKRTSDETLRMSPARRMGTSRCRWEEEETATLHHSFRQRRDQIWPRSASIEKQRPEIEGSLSSLMNSTPRRCSRKTTHSCSPRLDLEAPHKEDEGKTRVKEKAREQKGHGWRPELESFQSPESRARRLWN